MAQEFKVGDRVKCVGLTDKDGNGSAEVIHKEFTLTKWESGNFMTDHPDLQGTFTQRYYKLKLINKSGMSNPLDSFLLALKSEPDKSLIKAGLMTNEGLLTEDGQKIFFAWMLNKNKEDFKKEVADPILAEAKESE